MLIKREDLKAEYTDQQIDRIKDEDLENLNDLVWDYIKKLLDKILL